MTHVINKMRQLRIGLDDFMVPFRTVHLRCRRHVGEQKKPRLIAAKTLDRIYSKPLPDSNCVLPA